MDKIVKNERYKSTSWEKFFYYYGFDYGLERVFQYEIFLEVGTELGKLPPIPLKEIFGQ